MGEVDNGKNCWAFFGEMMDIPKKIYLQVMDDDGNELDEVTWCVDCIYEHDVMYVLPDPRSPTTVGAETDTCHDCNGKALGM